MINWDLISHPLNWLTVLLMVVIAAFAVEIAATAFTGEQTTE